MFKRLLAPHADRAYFLLRVVSGLMFSVHGMQKVLAHDSRPVGSQLWIGGVIELIGGLAIAAGVFASPAAFVASGTMAVAYVQFHWRFAGGKQLLPVINNGELALLYAFLFLYVACRGAGKWSIDERRSRAKR